MLRVSHSEPERTDTAQYLALIFAGLSDINGGSREDMKSAEKSVNDIISDMFEDDSEKLDIFTEGTLTSCDGRISISYNETELTGMEGTVTTITFKMDEPGIITVLRTGSVYTALTLEEGRRHICVYKAQGCLLSCMQMLNASATVSRRTAVCLNSFTLSKHMVRTRSLII